MGRASAEAQKLKQVITTNSKFAGSNDRLYLHVSLPHQVNGILRVGEKKLFIRDELAAIKEITPSCVLDFYVHESRQRSGIGRILFEFMLECESTQPSRFGYDRPSPKLLAFLNKYYQLANYIPQNNNFVVFRKYFSKEAAGGSGATSGRTSVDPRHGSNQDLTRARLDPAPHHTHAPSSHSYPSAGRRTHGNAAPPFPVGSSDSAFPRSAQVNFPQASPPPGQASFSHFSNGEEHDNARQIDFDEQHYPPQSSPHRGGYDRTQSSYGHPAASSAAHPSSGASASPAPAPGHVGSSSFDERRPSPVDGSSRLARAGSNMLSTTNLHANNNHNHNHNHNHSTNNLHRDTNQTTTHQPNRTYHPNDRPAHPRTQYHDHNIITGFQSSSGHSNFSNRPAAAADFLPDGIAAGVPQELTVDRKSKRGGIQPRPLLDPAANGLKTVDRNIDQLEHAIRAKENALSQATRYDIPYRTPSERDAGWSKAASYQRVVDSSGAVSSTTHAAPHHHHHHHASEQAEQYANPTTSTKVGGAAGPYANPYQPPPTYGRSPFAYGNVRR